MWIIVPGQSTSSPSAPGPAASSSGSGSLYRRLERSVTLNGTPSPAQSWKRACETAPWMRRLSGQISSPSRAARGVASWMSSLRATRASHSPPWASAGPRATPGTSGPTSPGSSANAGQPSSSARTSPTTSSSASRRSCTTFERWVTAAKQDYSLRQKWALRTLGTGSSLWPTPRACMPAVGNSNRYGENRLEDVLAGWMVRVHEGLGRDLKGYIRPLGREARTGDGSARIILLINLHFLTGMMNWPRGWPNPTSQIERGRFESWETESARRLLAMLSGYFSQGRWEHSQGQDSRVDLPPPMFLSAPK